MRAVRLSRAIAVESPLSAAQEKETAVVYLLENDKREAAPALARAFPESPLEHSMPPFSPASSSSSSSFSSSSPTCLLVLLDHLVLLAHHLRHLRDVLLVLVVLLALLLELLALFLLIFFPSFCPSSSSLARLFLVPSSSLPRLFLDSSSSLPRLCLVVSSSLPRLFLVSSSYLSHLFLVLLLFVLFLLLRLLIVFLRCLLVRFVLHARRPRRSSRHLVSCMLHSPPPSFVATDFPPSDCAHSSARLTHPDTRWPPASRQPPRVARTWPACIGSSRWWTTVRPPRARSRTPMLGARALQARRASLGLACARVHVDRVLVARALALDMRGVAVPGQLERTVQQALDSIRRPRVASGRRP